MENRKIENLCIYLVNKNGEFVSGLFPYLKNYITSNTILVMGKSTWNSLPDRYKESFEKQIVIVSSTKITMPLLMTLFRSPDAFLEYAEREKDKEFLVIGGAKLYEKSLNFAHKVLIASIEGSTEKSADPASLLGLSLEFQRILKSNFSSKESKALLQDGGIIGKLTVLCKK